MDNELLQVLMTGSTGGAAASASKTGVAGTSTTKPSVSTVPNNAVLDALVARLTEQGKGISTSSSSKLQSSIDQAITDTQTSGNLSRAALQSEREREVAFARDRAGATYTTALEGRSGYATQVAGLRELTETTEKSIRDLDKRYQEAMLANDAATAQRVADMRMKKEEFLMQQEQNFFNNIMGVANLQQTAIGQQQQNEQFWAEQEAAQQRFVTEMAQSSYQFQKNYGLQLQEMGLKEQQLEIERSRYNLSLQEYNDKKKALLEEKTNVNTRALIANDIKNKLQSVTDDTKLSRQQILQPAYLAEMREKTGFEGSTEELAKIVTEAYGEVSSDKKFMAEYLGAPTMIPFTNDRNANTKIQDINNKSKIQYDTDRGVTIQSPEGFWASIFR